MRCGEVSALDQDAARLWAEPDSKALLPAVATNKA